MCTGHLYLREQGGLWGSLEILDSQFAVSEKLQCLVSWSCKSDGTKCILASTSARQRLCKDA